MNKNINIFSLLIGIFLIIVGFIILFVTVLHTSPDDPGIKTVTTEPLTETKQNPPESAETTPPVTTSEQPDPEVAPTEEPTVTEPEIIEPNIVPTEETPEQTVTESEPEPVEAEPNESPIEQQPVESKPEVIESPPISDLGESEEENSDDIPDIISADRSLWNLILVNQDNYLPDGFEIETDYVQGNYDMDSRAAPYAKQMIADAKAEGIELQLCSAYRALDLQKRLFKNKTQEFLDLGYSQEDAEKEASAIVAIPGTSEHQTGLALDIVTPSYQRLNAGYEDTKAAKWLKENAWKYGFILRFPKDKVEITKIMFEPWHYRYVGTEYSGFIMENGLCLEEFLEMYGY